MHCNFLTLIEQSPNSVEKLFYNINQYISFFDPSWHLSLKPAPEEDIRQLEQIVINKYGQKLPPSYKTYLQKMGESDGGLVSTVMDCELEYWNYFKGPNMAYGTMEKIEDDRMQRHVMEVLNNTFSTPLFWYFYYTMLTGIGWGFAPNTKLPDQIVETHGKCFYVSHDTFSKFLFYCAYTFVENQVENRGTILGYSMENMDSLLHITEGFYSIRFCAECPKEWSVLGYAPLVNFLSEIETQFSIEECWFSGNKEFSLFDVENAITSIDYSFSRYVGIHAPSNLAIRINYIQSYGPEILVSVLCQNVCYTKQIVSAILRQVKLKKDSFRVLLID